MHMVSICANKHNGEIYIKFRLVVQNIELDTDTVNLIKGIQLNHSIMIKSNCIEYKETLSTNVSNISNHDEIENFKKGNMMLTKLTRDILNILHQTNHFHSIVYVGLVYNYSDLELTGYDTLDKFL